ncbi:MAG: aminotransferase class III-fold pyridoxal phosphate-dependent enzyme, partial [Desulfobacula sp.]
MKNILWSIGHELKLNNITHAKGCYIYDADGKPFLDMESGVWCTPLGHCHPEINHAIARQIENIMHTGYCYAHPIIEEAAKSILEIVGFHVGKCLFLTSGSEAVEVGVKAIKKISSKSLLLTFSDSFLGSLGSSGAKPSAEWFLFDWSQCNICPEKEHCDPNCPHFSTIPFEKISGFVFEPGSSSGMVKFPPKALISHIARRIQETDGYIQINEITTGMGRTGKWFGYMHYDIAPDIVSIGKGLGNGYPVSAVAFNKN